VGAIVHGAIVSEVVSGQLRRKLLVRYRRLSRHVLPKNSKEKNDRDCDLVTLQKLLDVIERDILPLTCLAVCTGKQLNRVWII
jgi:mannose/fructose/N-acetylgalactosamine-specific phosphotransferase system component IID